MVTLGHPANGVSLNPWERALQELKTIVPGPMMGANCLGFVMADARVEGLRCETMPTVISLKGLSGTRDTSLPRFGPLR